MSCPHRSFIEDNWVCKITNIECPAAKLEGFDYNQCSTYVEEMSERELTKGETYKRIRALESEIKDIRSSQNNLLGDVASWKDNIFELYEKQESRLENTMSLNQFHILRGEIKSTIKVLRDFMKFWRNIEEDQNRDNYWYNGAIEEFDLILERLEGSEPQKEVAQEIDLTENIKFLRELKRGSEKSVDPEEGNASKYGSQQSETGTDSIEPYKKEEAKYCDCCNCCTRRKKEKLIKEFLESLDYLLNNCLEGPSWSGKVVATGRINELKEKWEARLK